MVCCRDHSLYTGITNNPPRRLREHNSEKDGARYTRGRRPVVMVYLEPCPTRSAATRKENLIKKMPLARKNQLIREQVAQFLPTGNSP
jgi:putative endonuclease